MSHDLSKMEAPMEGEIVENVTSNLEISREATPEIRVDLGEIENLSVFDISGNSVRVGSFYSNSKCIIVLVRNFLCFACKEYVDDLAKIPEKYLKEAGVRLIVIGCAPWRFIKDFRYATRLPYEIFCDPERHLYKKLGCLEKMNSSKVSVSRHVKSGMLMGIFKSFWRGLEYREFQGDMNQQGASLVIGPGDVVHHVYLDQNMTDHTAINDLLKVAGVDLVNFDGDSRVLHL